MPRHPFSAREDLRPYSVLEHCAQCDFNDGQCNGWKCAAALAQRLSYYEYTSLVIPGIQSQKKEIVKRMMGETQIYVFLKLQIKWSLTPHQCVKLFQEHDLMHFMKHNDSVYYLLDPNDALENEYEEDLQKAVAHLLSLIKVPERFRDTVFETCFLSIALSEDYRQVLREVFKVRSNIW